MEWVTGRTLRTNSVSDSSMRSGDRLERSTSTLPPISLPAVTSVCKRVRLVIPESHPVPASSSTFEWGAAYDALSRYLILR